MGLPEIVESSRNFAVLVKVQGPDPKGMKMRKHAFHQYHSGNTTLSASGMLLPDNLYDTEVAKSMFGVNNNQSFALVITVASVIEPFLPLRHRASISDKGRLELIPGARIEIMAEGHVTSGKETPCWFPAQLLSLVDVPVSSAALRSVIEASSSSKDCGWNIGWSLASQDSSSQPATDIISRTEYENKSLIGGQRHVSEEESCNPSGISRSATRLAVLGVSLKSKTDISISSSSTWGDNLLVIGSPFGILSPVHFFNSISAGSIANCYPPKSSERSLLIADVRCLPGMEGSPVFDKHGHLLGILISPLRQDINGSEIQLVIPWQAIATARKDLLLKQARVEENGTVYGNKMLSENKGINPSPEVIVMKAVESICLITIDDGVWASGVLLNNQGLILTNAHLLEPWRFGKASVNGLTNLTDSKAHFAGAEEVSSAVDVTKQYHGFFHSGHRDIRVRLNHQDPWVWYPAKVVYICKGSLDVALLRLDHVPDKLHPIDADFRCPPIGSKAYVIGHGLFGPRCGFSPSVCSGVVSKVVKTMMTSYNQSVSQKKAECPAMLETTAAVHPGGSGGAVVNSDGHMVGLVTSNARHGGGTVIPHLNFSIPCAVLKPIFDFARADMQDLKILQNLDQPNEELSSVWALMPSLSPNQNPSLPGLPQSPTEGDGKEGKGSRFAKFMEERRELLGKPRGPVHLRNEMFRSKL